MLTQQYLRNNLEQVRIGLRKRNWTDSDLSLIDRIIEKDDKRKKTQTDLDVLLAERNDISKKIGLLFREGKKTEAEHLKHGVNELKNKIESLEIEAKTTLVELEEFLLMVPNIPHESVVQGKSDADNVIYKDIETELPNLGNSKLPHWELAERYGLIDFQKASSISGSGFTLFQGKGSRLRRALINFFLDQANAAGYLEISPPLLVNSDSARATGQLPDKEGQMYYIEKDDLYLIPTGEVPITNVYRDTILKSTDFPIKLAGHTPCFRREAGSYGSDVKGLNRVHQFDKIEIVQFQHPEKSYDTLYEMMAYVEMLLQKLELPYRIMRLCGGDLGFTSTLTYDFEVYSAAQEKWLEVSSVSNFETFQSNRMKLRFKNKKGKMQLAHTLNGSALALPRIIAALLENNQSSDGIHIPKVLREYTGFGIIN